jgi:hypothetical protein
MGEVARSTVRPIELDSEREAVRMDRRKKIGSMPQKSCDLKLAPIDPALGDHACPKCGVEMEPIEIAVEGLPLQQLQLCPGCYLVMWSDQNGFHVRQGVPTKKGVEPAGETGCLVGEPEAC